MNIKEHIEAGHYPTDEKGRALVPMRNGQTARIFLTDFDNPDFPAWPLVGLIMGRKEFEPRCWQASGGFHGTSLDGGPAGSPLDLLPPPPRKVKVRAYALVGTHERGKIAGLWEDRAGAERSQALACERVIELTGEYEEEWT